MTWALNLITWLLVTHKYKYHYCALGHCINYFSIAAIKYHDQGYLEKEGFICAYDQKDKIPSPPCWERMAADSWNSNLRAYVLNYKQEAVRDN